MSQFQIEEDEFPEKPKRGMEYPRKRKNDDRQPFRIWHIVAIVVLILIGATIVRIVANAIAPVNSTTVAPTQVFPEPSFHWIVADNTCGLTSTTVSNVDETFRQLADDEIATVFVACQPRVDNPSTWLVNWYDFLKRQERTQSSSIVFLIQPDKGSGQVVHVWISDSLSDFQSQTGTIVSEANNYALFDDINGAAEAIARRTDELLRQQLG